MRFVNFMGERIISITQDGICGSVFVLNEGHLYRAVVTHEDHLIYDELHTSYDAARDSIDSFFDTKKVDYDFGGEITEVRAIITKEVA